MDDVVVVDELVLVVLVVVVLVEVAGANLQTHNEFCSHSSKGRSGNSASASKHK